MRKLKAVAVIGVFALPFGPLAWGAPVLTEVFTGKSRHDPGRQVQISVGLANSREVPVTNTVRVSISWLTEPVASFSEPVILRAGEERVVPFFWKAGHEDFQGYGVDVEVFSGRLLLDRASTAVDVSSDWRRFPRYGFYTDYEPSQSREESEARALALSKCHINALQFYDWMYTHDRLFLRDEQGRPQERYREFGGTGKEMSLAVIRNKIQASQERNMACLAYSLIYGDGGTGGCPDRIEWAAFPEPQQSECGQVAAHVFGPFRIFVMDVSNPDWKKQIFGEYRGALRELGFDGFHLDNLGAARRYRRASDEAIDEERAFPAFINECAGELGRTSPGVALVHNAVMGQYRDAILASKADVYYQEVWEKDSYWDLREIITGAQAASGGGKAVVLAAYLNRDDPPGAWMNEPSVRLANAAIFAHGGFHLELGERMEMLSNEYFPHRPAAVSPSLAKALRSYYDVLVRYENVLSFNPQGGVVDATDSARLSCDTHALSKTASSNAVWTVLRRWPGRFEILHLINLCGADWAWRNQSPPPRSQTNLQFRLYLESPCRTLHWVSPDDGLGRPVPVPFTLGRDEGGAYVECVVPRLDYWGFLLFDVRPDGLLMPPRNPIAESGRSPSPGQPKPESR